MSSKQQKDSTDAVATGQQTPTMARENDRCVTSTVTEAHDGGSTALSAGVILDEDDLPPYVLNSVASSFPHAVDMDGESTVFLRMSNFGSAYRVDKVSSDDDGGAYLVCVEAMYKAGPAVATMYVVCWVHDDENSMYPAGSGVHRVSHLTPDPYGELFDAWKRDA